MRAHFALAGSLFVATLATASSAADRPTARRCPSLDRPRAVALGMDRVVRKVYVRVPKIIFRPCFWRADVRIRNTAPVAISISNGFALLLDDATLPRQNALPRLDATYLSHPLPRHLSPGQIWKSTVGGRGIPRAKTRVRLALGLFMSKKPCSSCIGFGIVSRDFAWP
jgi:hypothetical protein